MRPPIFVPSRGRAGESSTLRMFPNATIVVEPDEAEAYRASYPSHDQLVLPMNGQGVAYARQAILSEVRRRRLPLYWQIDDNLLGFTAYDGNWGRVDPDASLLFVEEMRDKVGAVLAGPGIRMWKYEGASALDSWVACCVLTATTTRIDYDRRFKCREDMDFSLAHVLAGFRTLRLLGLTIRKRKMGTVAGGLASVLDDRAAAERQDDELLRRKYPGLVKSGGKTRAVVSWKKAAAEARAGRQQRLM